VDLGISFFHGGQYDKATEQFTKALDLDSNFSLAHSSLGWAFEKQGMYEEAIVEFQKAASLDDAPWILTCLGNAYGRAGRKSEAHQVLKELTERAKGKYIAPYDMAVMYAGLGDDEQAFMSLEKAFEERSSLMVWWIQIDPMLDSIRSLPRFADLLRRVGCR
jgi:tetratricopeptide (TPR) repeat protein